MAALATALCFRPILPDIASARNLEILSFDCQWNHQEINATVVTITVDPKTMTAYRSDSNATYEVAQLNDLGVWLKLERLVPSIERSIVVQTISRSAVGGKWTDTFLYADGTVSTVVGGYCVEK